jgi:Cu+-exporting ATPase
MKCGGCVSGVKDVLESQPGVVSATVNLATETALVHVLVPRGSGSGSSGAAATGAATAGAAAVGAAAAGKKAGATTALDDAGDALAAALTKAGFRSAVRSLTAGGGGRGNSGSDAAAAK